MVKIDLITGFLGSGKTTFLKKYAARLLEKGQKVGILENDYGAVNVDMMLLSELDGESCMIETVAGACDYDCHKRRFKTKLIALGMSGLDRVIVEPSGIFDVDEFFDTLNEEPLDRWYEIGSVITIVDAPDESGFETLYFMNTELKPSDAQRTVGRLFDGSCGDVFRVKGFIRGDGWYELNATANQFRLAPIGNGQDIIIVIGENLDKSRISEII